MRRSALTKHASIIAIGFVTLSGNAWAQDAESAPAEEEYSTLDEIVVTASGRDQTKLESSISVTSVNAQMIQDFQPSSEAEVFKLLPGIQVPGTSGPGGNSNIAVRGLPVATGGAPFVQLQEDGLPVVLFGDIQFGNNDYWTRFDPSVANIEAVRGGSATTFASQAPGAVINYISNYGREEGGYVELKKGIDYSETQLNFRYGGALTDSMNFHVGGFFKKGRGPLNAGYNTSESLQVKANVTKEFDDGKGFFRLLFKYADTQEPNYTGAPALATISGNKVTSVRAWPGFDGREETNYSKYNQDFLIYNRDGNLERVKMDGITTKQKSIGGQFHYEFSENISIDNNFRWSDISGGFASPFLGIATRASILGSTVNGRTVAAIRYASGPNAGQLYTGQYVDNNVNVKTNIRDLGSLVNDLTLAGKFDMGFADLTARAGYFYMDQDIAMDWHVNKSLRELNGNSPSQLDLYDSATATAVANRITTEGISGYNNNWGNCCARDYDLSYTNTAPYVQLVLDNDIFNFDGSVRFEKVKASGYTIGGGAEFNIVSNGVTIPTMAANGARETLDYSRSYTSWTVGALWKATPDLSIFGRTSRGGRFNSDRQTVSGKFNADGSLCTRAQATALACTDGVTPSVDYVTQHEIGIKNRGSLGSGRYSVEFTLLKGDFKRSDFEPTVTGICPGGGCVIDNSFKTQGAEFFATLNFGGFNFIANATYTKAKQKFTSTRGGTQVAGSANFGRALGIPDLSYSLTASYDVAEIATLGVTAVGQSSTFDGTLTYPGKTVFNTNLKVRPIENLELGLNVYNLFNTYDARGNGVGVFQTGTPAGITGTPVIGRTLTGTARFSF
ncbi:TonB-dependent receptor [Sphingorhabdus sp.]|uniref:TonB-dependent receptor n=3 Tax=Sphingorhabdus sp. TaxID=1902408 RepID=UPI003C71E7CB